MQLTHSDIENYSDYKASGINLSGGYSQSMGGGKSAGSPNTVGQGTTWSEQQFGTGVQGAAAGISSDRGNERSTTHSGISADAVTITDEAAQQQKTGQSASEAAASIQSNVLTGDGSNGLQKNWDGQKLLQEQAANAQIMATFGQQASKAAGTYADQQAIAARRADNEAEARKCDEGGEYRTALHAGIGALTGGVQGAAGAALSAIALPEIGERIAALNLPDSVRDALNASIGAALGAAAGLNQAGNNYISYSPFRQVRLASSLGGVGDRLNIVPQASTLNRGEWRSMENYLRGQLQAGKNVSMKIEVGYPVSGGVRPDGFIVDAIIDGDKIQFKFKQ